MGTVSLVAPLVMPRLLRPLTPGRGRWGRATVATGRRGRRRHHGRRPGPPRRRARPAALLDREGGVRRWRRRRGRRRRGGDVDVGVAHHTRAPVAPPSRPRSRRRPARARRRHPRLGLHLLLEPPLHAREPLHVGRARRAPLERALQPVDRAAPAGGRAVRHLRPLRRRCAWSASRPAGRDRPGRQPPLPVLDPHRDDRAPGPGRGGRSTRRRTIGSTTARTAGTSTATTAAS